MPNDLGAISRAQSQTAQTFGYKWQRRDDWESPHSRAALRAWLIERYGDVANAPWWSEYPKPALLDAGCGGGMSALELFGPRLLSVDYVGVDISEAVEVAKDRLTKFGVKGRFIRADLTKLTDVSPDVIFSEGVLHHTDSTRDALHALAKLLKPGGRFLFYVYRKKGPVREFTDDLIRDKLQSMTPDQALEAMRSLTLLGKALGELNVKVTVPEAVDLLGIPAGEIDVQRLFYWHVCKMFYRPEFSVEEMQLTNFDWFAPKNAHRQSVEEVREWCTECGLRIERENVQEAGITVQAVKV